MKVTALTSVTATKTVRIIQVGNSGAVGDGIAFGVLPWLVGAGVGLFTGAILRVCYFSIVSSSFRFSFACPLLKKYQ